MGYTDKLLDDIRSQIAPSDETLQAARSRRDDVLSALKGFDGRLRDFVSGSIGHRTANNDTDADCGIVINRRVFPDLGPNGDGIGPQAIVERARSVARESLTGKYPNLTTRLTRRAIEFQFYESLDGGDDAPDPSVDLIVGLTRVDAPGLWIPNLKSNGWDPSHPEYHTKLLTDPPDDLRRLRARAIRLVKAWNGQYTKPALCSFNIEALALEVIVKMMSLGEAVTVLFEYSARELQEANTKDPADVSPPIKLLLDRDTVVTRLKTATKHMRTALDHDDDEDRVTEELAVVFRDFIQQPAGDSSKAALASALRGGHQGFNRAGIYVPAVGVGSQLKPIRSHGDGKVS